MNFHPWLCAPEAIKAAKVAARDAMPKAGRDMNYDELLSEALAVLAECALPPCERWNASRHGLRRHVGGSAMPGGHIGSMWSWQEGERETYAVREIAHRLGLYLKIRAGAQGPE